MASHKIFEKKTLLENYENMFFEKLRSLISNNKLFLYSKIKTNYIIEPSIENSNFENRKLIVKMRISDHVLEIERGRYNKINSEQRICRQCHLNVIEDEEHFFFHCQKNRIIRKGMFNPDCLMQFAALFIQVMSTEESGLNITA